MPQLKILRRSRQKSVVTDGAASRGGSVSSTTGGPVTMAEDRSRSTATCTQEAAAVDKSRSSGTITLTYSAAHPAVFASSTSASTDAGGAGAASTTKPTATTSSSQTSTSGAPTFPFLSLPYDIQRLVSQHALQAPSPILIGRAVPPPWDHVTHNASQRANALLQLNRELALERRADLLPYFYTRNSFELGFYCGQSPLFTSAACGPARALIRTVVVDVLRLLSRPREARPGELAVNVLIGTLGLLPGLRVLRVRLNDRAAGSASNMYKAEMAYVLRAVVRELSGSLRAVEFVVEVQGEGEPGKHEAWLAEHRALIDEHVAVEDKVWPDGVPEGREMVTFEYGWTASIITEEARLRKEMWLNAPNSSRTKRLRGYLKDTLRFN